MASSRPVPEQPANAEHLERLARLNAEAKALTSNSQQLAEELLPALRKFGPIKINGRPYGVRTVKRSYEEKVDMVKIGPRVEVSRPRPHMYTDTVVCQGDAILSFMDPQYGRLPLIARWRGLHMADDPERSTFILDDFSPLVAEIERRQAQAGTAALRSAKLVQESRSLEP